MWQGDCHIKVRRDHIFKDSYEEIMGHSPNDLKKRLMIKLDGEDKSYSKYRLALCLFMHQGAHIARDRVQGILLPPLTLRNIQPLLLSVQIPRARQLHPPN